jgi:D-threo-aldose 1-dehydrogenase
MSSPSLSKRPLGSTGLQVSSIAIGAAAWTPRDEAGGLTKAVQTLLHAFDNREIINYVDTANNYGDGASEEAVGLAIREYGGVPEGFVIQTKADRDMVTGEYSARRMRISLEQSLERLGLDRLPIVFMHDPEHTSYPETVASGGPLEALLEAKESGLIGALGIAGGPVAMMLDYVKTGRFEALITHSRFNLVDRAASELIDEAHARGMGVLSAAPYAGGALVAWPLVRDRYSYASPEKGAVFLQAADSIGRLLADQGIPLAAAALQLSARDERITSTIVGMLAPSEFDQTVELLDVPIGDELWTEIDRLLPPRENWHFGRIL